MKGVDEVPILRIVLTALWGAIVIAFAVITVLEGFGVKLAMFLILVGLLSSGFLAAMERAARRAREPKD